MTYDEIVQHVVQARFKGSQVPQIRRWVDYRYSKIWAHADWPWKLVSGAPISVVAGSPAPVLPSGVARPRYVYDENGGALNQMTSEAFDSYFGGSGTGNPGSWKWENGVLTLGPTPAAATTLKLTYDRAIAHRDAAGLVIVDGSMDADQDLPAWDNREFDYILVPGAIATGLKEENDPTWRDLEEEFQFGNQDMIEYYLPSIAAYGNVQYGADAL